jgi:hypothetical protein
MCQPGQIAPGAPGDDAPFRTDAKCCTATPRVANFLAGRILAGPPSPGRASIERRIDTNVSVTPQGLGAPRPGDALSRCAHYEEDGGGCGIWSARPAACATWFCRHDRGARGSAFWAAARAVLAVLEERVAQWCLVALDAGDAVLAGEGWGTWGGRVRELYVACAERAADVGGEEALAIAGPSARMACASLRHASQVLEKGPPLIPLRVGPFRSAPAGDGLVRVWAYDKLDPLEVPEAVVDRLVELAALSEHGSDADLVRRLVDFGVLAPYAEEA